MLRKIIKRAASVILAIAIMVAYVPMVAIAAEGEAVTAESYQALLDKVAEAETALAEAEATLTEEEILAAKEVLATAQAELDAVEANMVEARFMVRDSYSNGTVSKRVLLGTGLAYKNEDRTYTMITVPENVQELIDAGVIEEVSANKSGNTYRVEYRYTDTSVTAAFYALKEDKSVPTDEITSQSKKNYVYVGSGVIDTYREQLFGEDNLPSEIQDIQFDLANDEDSKYVWYVVKQEGDGWHVDGYVVTEKEPIEEETTPEETTTVEEETTTAVEEETTTAVEEETTTAVEEETTTVVEEETTTAVEEETTTAVEEETTTAVEEETTTAVEEETTTAVEEETTTAVEEETTTVVEEETTTVVEEETTREIYYGPVNPVVPDEYDEPEEVPTTPVAPVEPESTPVVEFEDEVTPLAPPMDWVEFEDEETPLDDMPQTGSMNLVLPAMAVSCAALVVATVSRKKEDGAAE